MLGATTYLHDVAEGGGGTLLWPRTHIPTHRYFSRHPEKVQPDVAPRFGEIFSDSGSDETPMPPDPFEFIGQAGDACFWHNFIFHSGSANLSGSPRLAVFARWHHRDLERARFQQGQGDDSIWEAWDGDGSGGLATPGAAERQAAAPRL
jgi:ectoine hydroxylase-related dioxygenase (phytanoyl-CoA dioxygenase family)